MPEQTTDIDVNLKPFERHQPPVQVGTARQVLFDDFFLSIDRVKWDQLAYGIRFSLGPVQKHGDVILCGDAPWEKGMAWMSLLREKDLYRMWYNSSHADRRGLRVSYAESADGIDWHRPNLGLVEVDGSKENNVVFEGGYGGNSPELGNVFYDPQAEPGETYKMLYSDWIDGELFEARPPGVEYNGALRGASSPDGIRWKRYSKNFWVNYADSQNVACWDPNLDKYVMYHRTGCPFAGLEAGAIRVQPQPRGRAVGRMESDGYFYWSNSKPVLVPDMEDGLNTDIYNSAYGRHPDNENVHYLFPSFYRHYEGTFEVQVCTSRDNIQWQRPCRDTFIPLGAPGEFDCFIISVAPGFIPVDDQTWALYYRSGDGPHGGSQPFDLGYTSQSRMSRVTIKRDRIVGIEADPSGGHFCTRPIAFRGRRLVLNAEPTGPDPEIKVQLLSAATLEPIEGYGFDECRPIREDGLDIQVAWNESPEIGQDVPRDAVRLHFSIRSMRIYAFQFLDP